LQANSYALFPISIAMNYTEFQASIDRADAELHKSSFDCPFLENRSISTKNNPHDSICKAG